jgi:hypothetical protein
MIAVWLGVLAMVVGTWFGAPTLTPILVGAAIGVTQPSQPARKAALAGLIAWGCLLLVAAVRGDALGPLSRTLGAGMGIPGWALFAATLLYPAILASSSAWIAHLLVSRGVRARNAGAT